MKRLSISNSSKYFRCFTCIAIQYLSNIWNWGLGRLMHHLFKNMYKTLGVNLVFSILAYDNKSNRFDNINEATIIVNNTTQNCYFQKVF